MYTFKKCYWINDKGVVMSDDYLYTYVMQDHDEHFTAVYDKSSVKQIATDNFNVLSDRIMFKDDNTHTIYIYSLNGDEVSSASTKDDYKFNLHPGIYILTVDGKTSTKIMIK